MDLLALGHRFLTALPSTNTTNDFSDLPIKLIEAIVPGYSLFTNVIQQYSGVDISLIMTCVAFFFIARRALAFVWARAHNTFHTYCTSCVIIDGSDDLYNTIVQWIAATRPDLSRRSLTAHTQYGSMSQYDSDDESGDEDAEVLASVAVDSNGYFNFHRWAARAPPRYEPSYGCFWFRTPHGIFEFNKLETFVRNSDSSERVECRIELRCVGFSANPIKLLLADIKAWTVKKQSSKTVIRVPCSERWNLWMRASERPSRPLDTVILDPDQKKRILWDMNEYLHPLSPKWYAARGIPYRRGYLFHGPPGTGKTSLSFSLAGIFGLDIHIVNLMDPTLNESLLSRLFNNLPKRCIVLFEDIDAAGVKKREDDSDADSETEADEPVKKSRKTKSRTLKGKKVEDRGRSQKRCLEELTSADGQTGDADQTNGCSVEQATPAAIDSAVASPPDIKTNGHEILDRQHNNTSLSSNSSDSDSDSDTTSTPSRSFTRKKISINALARALLHASRTSSPTCSPFSSPSPPPRRRRHRRNSEHSPNPDSKISLSGLLNVIDGVATHESRILIMTTNHPEKLDPALIRSGRVDLSVEFCFATREQSRDLFRRMYGCDDQPDAHDSSCSGEKNDGNSVTEEELSLLAERFGDELPEGKFAPSDVQGYLLCHRKRPRDAVEGVAEWRKKKEKEMLEKAKLKAKAGRKKRR